MQIDKEKKYSTVGGDDVRIYAVDGMWPHPVYGAVKTPQGWITNEWTIDGEVYAGGQPNKFDLVESKQRFSGYLAFVKVPVSPCGVIAELTTNDPAKIRDVYRNKLVACIPFSFEEGEGV